jgi:tungstate transport system substrate-binding protein
MKSNGMLRTALAVSTLLLVVATAGRLRAESEFITLASTTSTENSGLLAHLLPRFLEASGIEVRVVAVGTGKALRLAQKGDADVLLVHDRASEDRFVAEGYGAERVDVMFNDFVVLGPPGDPAGVKGQPDVAAAFAKIAADRSFFVSRGDDSGTHKAELRLWKAAGLDPRPDSGSWYLETGSGMGKTLNVAAEKNAYALCDRGTWLSFKNPGDLEIVLQGDSRLFNPYGAILVSPARHPHVKAAAGRAFIDWLVSDAGRAAIDDFRVNGQILFRSAAR